MIVDSSEDEPYHYDEERILQFGDYYNKTDSILIEGLLANPFKWTGETNALLLNGKSGTKAGNSTTAVSSCAPAIIRVSPGKTYKFRWIGSTAISLITLGIEDHPNVTIVEADGSFTQPFQTDHIQIASGQRFSTIFTAKSLPDILASNKTSYWLQMENRERPANVSGYALLQYDLDGYDRNTIPSLLPANKPVDLPSRVYDWLEYALQPLNPDFDPFPPLANVTRTIYIQANQLINGTYQWQQNGTALA